MIDHHAQRPSATGLVTRVAPPTSPSKYAPLAGGGPGAAARRLRTHVRHLQKGSRHVVNQDPAATPAVSLPDVPVRIGSVRGPGEIAPT